MTDVALGRGAFGGTRLTVPNVRRAATATRRRPVPAAVRRRLLVRRAVVATVVAGLLAVGVADARAHTELGQVARAQLVAAGDLSGLGADLTLTRANAADELNASRYFEVQTTQNRLMVGSTDTLTQQQEVGTYVDEIDLSALDGCLNGVTQALDQIDVGQTAGGLASLGAAGPVCQAAGS